MAKKTTRTYSGTGSDKPAAPVRAITIDTRKSAQRLDDADQVDIVTIDDTTYTMSSAPRAEIGLRFLELIGDGEESQGVKFLFEETVGVECYEALMAVRGLDQAQLDAIIALITSVALPKGSSSGRSTSKR